MMEFAPKKNTGWMSTVWNMHDSLTIVFTILVYRYWNSDWHNTLYWCCFVQSISLLSLVFFIPESPKWLYDQKNWGELHISMTYMASINGKKLKSSATLIEHDRMNIAKLHNKQLNKTDE